MIAATAASNAVQGEEPAMATWPIVTRPGALSFTGAASSGASADPYRYVGRLQGLLDGSG
jgi:hypothetical protein